MSPIILVVDDNPINLKLACDVLEFSGYSVLRAEHAEGVLALLRDHTPDLILMDLSMPGMDGLTLTRKLKSEESTKGITIVALTASAMIGDDTRVIEAGCDGYITKPIDTRKFADQVASYLDNNDVGM
jgi:CheY-like chemotaxis protein